jgi:hypothetical protein
VNREVENNFVYVVATVEGKWYMITTGGITNITPGVGANPNVALSGYTNDINITTSWVGNVLFINDTLRPPMYFLQTATEIYLYGSPPDNYVWNYDIGVSATRAGFVRNFCSPNVGNILIAGNITKDYTAGATVNYPTTVRWSQAFANTGAPASWVPTLNNVANEQEIPVRGPIVDGFFLGGNFYVCSYWDTVVFSPIAYQNSTAPIFGIRLFNQGRGLINNNCWSNTDTNVYGVDSRDIWVFNGSDFAPLGNQKVRDYFYANLNNTYSDRLFMVNNTQKNQIEIYYPDLNSTGWCNRMLSYRYDLQVWNAPKQINGACNACEAPIFTNNVINVIPLLASRTVVYVRGVADGKLVQKDQGYEFLTTETNPDGNINSLFRRDNIKLLKDYSGKLMVHRILPEVVNLGAIHNDNNEIPIYPSPGNITVTIEGANSVGSIPTSKTPVTIPVDANGSNSKNPWAQINQNAFRVNTIELSNSSNTDIWMCSATTWQVTQVEDDR